MRASPTKSPENLGFKQRVDPFYEYSSTFLETASACIFPWPTESGTKITRCTSKFKFLGCAPEKTSVKCRFFWWIWVFFLAIFWETTVFYHLYSSTIFFFCKCTIQNNGRVSLEAPEEFPGCTFWLEEAARASSSEPWNPPESPVPTGRTNHPYKRNIVPSTSYVIYKVRYI
jgi:hypothetical protein